MCEYQCCSPGAHTAAVTSVTQTQDSRKFADHPCSHVICRASLPAGKCPSATKEARHGTCSHGLHPQRCALIPWGVFLMMLSPQLLFGQIKPWWLQQKQGEWGHVWVQEELTAFQSHLWTLLWVVGGFCSYYGLNTAMVNVSESLHWNTFLSYWKKNTRLKSSWLHVACGLSSHLFCNLGFLPMQGLVHIFSITVLVEISGICYWVPGLRFLPFFICVKLLFLVWKRKKSSHLSHETQFLLLYW